MNANTIAMGSNQGILSRTRSTATHPHQVRIIIILEDPWNIVPIALPIRICGLILIDYSLTKIR
jgi:hypothetical protein